MEDATETRGEAADVMGEVDNTDCVVVDAGQAFEALDLDVRYDSIEKLFALARGHPYTATITVTHVS